MIRTFDDWKIEADGRNLLETAKRYGAVMKKVGREFKGPCPNDGGRDRFSLSTITHKWFCRGGQCGGRGAISMLQHIAGLSFLQACEALTGEPNPTTNRPSRPLSDSEKAERNRQRLKMEEATARRQAQEMQYQEDTTAMALRIWEASTAIDGTLAQTYLCNRGFPKFEADVLRFHPALPYPGKSKLYPALVCRVDSIDGTICAIWRTYLREDGRKADVPVAKLGLGPAGGGAVRLGGVAPKVAVAEGLESALGFWFLTGRKYPVFAALSTSGMIGIELPLGVDHCVIVPDGDAPIRKKDGDYVPSVPAGRKAAEALRSRLLTESIACTIAAEPPPSKDYADLWVEHAREVA